MSDSQPRRAGPGPSPVHLSDWIGLESEELVPRFSASGTITLLLADVEGSARLWEADRDGMRATIARLEEIVANETRRHRGIRPVEQGEGDSFVLGFGKASDAVACALAIQRATAGERWPHSGVLLVRMALNSGELDAPQGKFDRTAINRCARIRDLAHGGLPRAPVLKVGAYSEDAQSL